MKKSVITGLAALLSASAISCGTPRRHERYELHVNDLLMFSDPSSEYYDPETGTAPFIAYVGTRETDPIDSLHDDYVVIGRGKYDEYGLLVEYANEYLVLDGEIVSVEDIDYEFANIFNDNDGLRENNVLNLWIEY